MDRRRQGDPAHAWRVLLDTAQIASSPHDAAFLAYDALRTGAPAATVAPMLADLDARSDAPLITAAAAHAAGLLDGDGAVLLDAAERLETIGALRCGCEAAANTTGAFLAEGQEGPARRAAAHSRRLFVDGEGAAAADRRARRRVGRAVGARGGLAALAAQGLSNAEIAERLVLSVRSVETYLYRAMHKLGVNDRRELAHAVGGAPAPRRIAS